MSTLTFTLGDLAVVAAGLDDPGTDSTGRTSPLNANDVERLHRVGRYASRYSMPIERARVVRKWLDDCPAGTPYGECREEHRAVRNAIARLDAAIEAAENAVIADYEHRTETAYYGS